MSGTSRRISPVASPVTSFMPRLSCNRVSYNSVLGFELRLAALAAEVDRLALVLDGWGALDGGDGHPADGVDRDPRRRVARRAYGSRRVAGGEVAGAGAAAHRDDLRQDRECDLGGSAGADVDAGGHVDQPELLVGDAVCAQLVDHACAALAAGHQADVRNGRVERSAEGVELVATVGRDDEREVAGRRFRAVTLDGHQVE